MKKETKTNENNGSEQNSGGQPTSCSGTCDNTGKHDVTLLALKQEASDLKDLLQRTQASFENYRKQTEKRMVDIQQFAAKNTIIQLLPILDNFELALKNDEAASFKDGVELIYAELNKIIENNDVEEISVLGKMFDPFKHEALMKEISDEKENTVIEVFQKGYKMHGTVIRHARVKLSAGTKNNDDVNNVKNTMEE